MKRTAWIVLLASLAGCQSMRYGISYPQPTPIANCFMDLDNGSFDRAIVQCTSNMRRWPDFYGNYAFRAQAFYKKGMYDEAIADYSKAIEMKPDNWELYLDRGRAYYDQHRFEEAEADMEKSISLKDTAMARAFRGGLLGRNGKFDEALSELDKALALDPSLDMARGARGAVLLSMKKDSEALKDFEAYLAKFPKNDEIVFLEGVAYFRLGRADNARPIANAALELDPKLGASFSGERLLDMFDLDKRREAVRGLLEQARKARDAGDWDSAFRSYSAAWGQTMRFLIADRAADDEAHAGLIAAYSKLKDKPALPESGRRYMIEAKTLLKEQGDPGPATYRSALKSYQRLLRPCPGSPTPTTTPRSFAPS
jgi:tetratricopeptide (TPR) repeat protein